MHHSTLAKIHRLWAYGYTLESIAWDCDLFTEDVEKVLLSSPGKKLRRQREYYALRKKHKMCIRCGERLPTSSIRFTCTQCRKQDNERYRQSTGERRAS